MRLSVMFVFILCIQFQVFSLTKDKTEKWHSPKSNLTNVYVVKDDQHTVELIRLYDDFQYEFLLYENIFQE